MLIKFDSDAGTITMFGDAAVALLKLMGQSGVVPGAILGKDIPAAVERLKRGVASAPADTPAAKTDDKETEPNVSLRQRAFPLIDLLERAAGTGADVMWTKV